jgi:hypothetical protein
MNAKETIAFLSNYNSWRRGDETIEMPSPSEIGAAIDDAVNLLRKYPEGWIKCLEKMPVSGQRVLAKYEGVYGPQVVTYWFDGTNHHFGHPPFSEPATHWCSIPQ